MTTRVVRPLIGRIARFAGADGNPLRRRIDRVEAGLRFALVLAFLIVGPLVTPATGHLTTVTGLREVRLEHSWRQVDVVLLRSAPPQLYGYGSMATYWVLGRWRAPSGVRRTGLVPAQAGIPSGTVIRIWVDWSGRVTGRRPVTAQMVTVRAVLVEVLTVVGLAAVLVLLAGLIRWLLNRRRMMYWALEWACIGPRWTSRR